MPIRIAMNGFGRVGRVLMRIAKEQLNDDIEIVAINARSSVETLGHLLKFDSSYGHFNGTIEYEENALIIDNRKIRVFSSSDPKELPYKELGVDIAVDTTGAFTKRSKAMSHIEAGAKKVIITAPGTDEDITIVMGVNEGQYESPNHHIISNASCTTNCLAPVAKVLDENFGIVKGLMTTVHAYTNDQEILDKSHKDLRRARAAAVSIIPTTTGAAKAVGKVLPSLNGKINGFALRVPTPTVSITDFVCELKKEVTEKEINEALKNASQGSLKGILGYSDEPLVSVDYKGDPRSSIVDGLSTMVTGKNMAKVVSWYDNEWGYTCRVADLINYVAERL
ncbi:glyceraldehyde-3-phosphate dehydrogenase 2 [Oxobacter pfennigii]|uniref:Glyceraldehyde-3-phosphate dehydrogenase n=1 Tax=Oxobacter pfennigii TaxID=36849 RepID=A0A0P8WVN8_9CLOT|nr:type I glyceraldehyde-3-phosphate dehydrogenase [Oxobacter pfennigii]KPU42317.1 glyceraldehyde-3-phosphate dehydrogenase 2 [Oxobacter pfennigii]